MKVTLFVSLMVVALAIPIFGVQALGLWYSHRWHCVLTKLHSTEDGQ